MATVTEKKNKNKEKIQSIWNVYGARGTQRKEWKYKCHRNVWRLLWQRCARHSKRAHQCAARFCSVPFSRLPPIFRRCVLAAVRVGKCVLIINPLTRAFKHINKNKTHICALLRWNRDKVHAYAPPASHENKKKQTENAQNKIQKIESSAHKAKVAHICIFLPGMHQLFYSKWISVFSLWQPHFARYECARDARGSYKTVMCSKKTSAWKCFLCIYIWEKGHTLVNPSLDSLLLERRLDTHTTAHLSHDSHSMRISRAHG